MPYRFKLSTMLLILVITSISYSQTEQSLIKDGAPKVYIDCGLCDINYIKEQIPTVNYVNDRKDADVHVLFVSQRTGAERHIVCSSSARTNLTALMIRLNLQQIRRILKTKLEKKQLAR